MQNQTPNITPEVHPTSSKYTSNCNTPMRYINFNYKKPSSQTTINEAKKDNQKTYVHTPTPQPSHNKTTNETNQTQQSYNENPRHENQNLNQHKIQIQNPRNQSGTPVAIIWKN